MHRFSSGSTTKLLAWVPMPDHWHGLVELAEGEGLSAWVGRFKGSSALAVSRGDPQVGRVWADGFHDHALRKDEAMLDCARYIVLNPVRAGLVRRIGDYAFWDAVWL